MPARSGSKGIPGKNIRLLGGRALVSYALDCAYYAGCDPIVVSTDIDAFAVDGVTLAPFQVLWRPPEFASDTAAMIDVVNHALGAIPGPDDQIIVLLQPTQPLRTPAHVREAIRLLRETPNATSVVSVVELPATHHPEFALMIDKSNSLWTHGDYLELGCLPTRRQDVKPVYRRDGTVYAFWRRTVLDHSDIYGWNAVPLIIPPEESCELDTESDWADVERRWRDRGQA